MCRLQTKSVTMTLDRWSHVEGLLFMLAHIFRWLFLSSICWYCSCAAMWQKLILLLLYQPTRQWLITVFLYSGSLMWTFRPLCPLQWRFWRYLRQIVPIQAVQRLPRDICILYGYFVVFCLCVLALFLHCLCCVCYALFASCISFVVDGKIQTTVKHTFALCLKNGPLWLGKGCNIATFLREFSQKCFQ